MNEPWHLDYDAVQARVKQETAPEAVPPLLTIREDPIRADCELIHTWDHRHDQEDDSAWRYEILIFILNRRGVIDWPSWGSEWVEGTHAKG